MSLSLQDQFTPLTIAAKKGHASIVDMLLAHGANVNHVETVSYVICNIHVLLRKYCVCLVDWMVKYSNTYQLLTSLNRIKSLSLQAIVLCINY